MSIDPSLQAAFVASAMLDVVTPLRALREAFVAQGFDLMIVGGAVRDVLSGRQPQDIDLATDALPEEQEAIYTAAGITHHATGLHHGTWTVVIGDVPYEISSLRTRGHQGSPNGSKSRYTRAWSLDLERRDLTFNAMALDFDSRVIDPFGGAADLRNGVVRFVGRAEDRIVEDPLRILRWLRFCGSHGTGAVDQIAFDAVRQHVGLLASVAPERVWKEIRRMVTGPRPVTMFTTMLAAGVGPAIGLPVLADDGLCWQFAAACSGHASPEVSLARYLDDDDKIRALAARWKWSNDERKTALGVSRLLKHANGQLSLEEAQRIVATRTADRNVVFEALRAVNEGPAAMELITWKPPIFPLGGKDLLEMGIPAGQDLGNMLRDLRAQWADSGYALTAGDLKAGLRP